MTTYGTGTYGDGTYGLVIPRVPIDFITSREAAFTLTTSEAAFTLTTSESPASASSGRN